MNLPLTSNTFESWSLISQRGITNVQAELFAHSSKFISTRSGFDVKYIYCKRQVSICVNETDYFRKVQNKLNVTCQELPQSE